jgi:hypothetical protein
MLKIEIVVGKSPVTAEPEPSLVLILVVGAVMRLSPLFSVPVLVVTLNTPKKDGICINPFLCDVLHYMLAHPTCAHV